MSIYPSPTYVGTRKYSIHRGNVLQCNWRLQKMLVGVSAAWVIPVGYLSQPRWLSEKQKHRSQSRKNSPKYCAAAAECFNSAYRTATEDHGFLGGSMSDMVELNAMCTGTYVDAFRYRRCGMTWHCTGPARAPRATMAAFSHAIGVCLRWRNMLLPSCSPSIIPNWSAIATNSTRLLPYIEVGNPLQSASGDFERSGECPV